MTSEQKQLVLATVPVLKEHGLLLTTHFYARMFRDNPELKNIFNKGNQQNGKQQTALANAVLAYAEHIENPQVLLPFIDSICQKHTSLDIRPEHYLIVGKHLIASIKEILGEAANAALLDAWTAAYKQLAGIMSGHEAGLYRTQTLKPNGWTGWRLFKVMHKEMESTEICSFHLYPADGGKVPYHKPGQYVSIKLLLPELKMNQVRQYSISNAPNDIYYQISVKRETDINHNINGMISNQLHNKTEVGSFVELSAPAGNFVMSDNLNLPFMFISGGIGVTPFMSMLMHLNQQQTTEAITWIHGCRNESVHAFKTKLEAFAKNNSNLKHYVFYNTPSEKSQREGVYEGNVDLKQIAEIQHKPNTHYFICGPSPFIQKQFTDLMNMGIDRNRIFIEEFGPQVLQLN